MRPADLRLRLVAALGVVASISALRTLPVAAATGAAILGLALAAGWRRPAWRRLLHVEAFLLLLFLTLPFTMAGTPLFSLGPLAASAEGVARAALVAAKTSACVMVLMLLLGDIEPARLGAALRALHVPERLVRLFVMTVRYADLIREEAARLHEAMRARAFRARSSRHTWRSYGNLVGMLLVRALERARRVEEAMLCRGLSRQFPYRAAPAPSLRDWAGFGLLAGAALAALLADRL